MKTSIITGAVCLMMLWRTVNAGDDMMKVRNIKSVSQTQWDELAQKKIYFGHQSVGYNIIDGIKDIMAENPAIRLNIVETRDPADFNAPVFAHSPVGRNTDPCSKIDDFKKIMESGVGDRADIAFFKFCYVDIRRDIDIVKIFEYYFQTMREMENRYPNVTFLHCTVPVKVEEDRLKGMIKRIAGKPLQENRDNILRNRFNAMLLSQYGDRVVDIAGFESTYPDGKRKEFSAGKDTFYALAPDYTDDGGHLNSTGRKKVAGELLIYLARGN